MDEPRIECVVNVAIDQRPQEDDIETLGDVDKVFRRYAVREKRRQRLGDPRIVQYLVGHLGDGALLDCQVGQRDIDRAQRVPVLRRQQ
jgi:hypothetical protein